MREQEDHMYLNQKKFDAIFEDPLQFMGERCTLCDEIHGTSEFLRRIFGRQINRKILETDNEIVVPTLGQIVKGYLLVVPKTHAFSLAALPLNEFESATRTLRRVEEIVKGVFKNCVIFEHGTNKSGSNGGCGIGHAHVHVVPGAIHLTSVTRHHDCRPLSTWEEMRAFAGDDYILIKNGSGINACRVEAMESQYLRKAIAKEVGREDRWDWRMYIGKKEMFETMSLYWNSQMLANLIEHNGEKRRFMKIAQDISQNSTCDIRRVGALLVKNGKVVAKGWNDAPVGSQNCRMHGHQFRYGHCVRTKHAEVFCVENALGSGCDTSGAELFITAYPCCSCMRVIVEAGIKQVYYKPYTIDVGAEALAKSSGTVMTIVQ